MAASLAQVYAFFASPSVDGSVLPTKEDKAAYPLAKFRTDYAELSPESKTQLAEGIGDKTFTY
jgi:hypothetical protein